MFYLAYSKRGDTKSLEVLRTRILILKPYGRITSTNYLSALKGISLDGQIQQILTDSSSIESIILEQNKMQKSKNLIQLFQSISLEEYSYPIQYSYLARILGTKASFPKTARVKGDALWLLQLLQNCKIPVVTSNKMQFQYLDESLGLKYVCVNDRSSNVYTEGTLTASI